MDRLLSPNEATFWLMDRTAPMNAVAVVRSTRRLVAEDLSRACDFALPVVAMGPHRRPRWEEATRQGVVSELRSDDEGEWLRVTEQLNQERVGTDGHPPWRAVVIQHERGSSLVLSLLHALVDLRSGLWITHQFMARAHAGRLAPACEDLLPPSAFSRADALELLDQWWLPRTTARWEAIGPEKLGEYLATSAPSLLRRVCFSEEETAALRIRCHSEAVSLHSAVAAALHDAIGTRRVGYAVDMRRFIVPALAEAPGLALSHVGLDLTGGAFWAAARDIRTRLREAIASGAAGDALLKLPELLLARSGEPLRDSPTMGVDVTISDLTRARMPGPLSKGCSMQQGTSSARNLASVNAAARGGGNAVSISFDGDRLQLVSSCPADRDGLPLDLVRACMRRALD